MADFFKPLLPERSGPDSRGSFRLKVLAPAPARPAFSPIGSLTAKAAADSPSRHPVVTLQRDGDRVIGIRIECTCGQVIELACQY